MSIRRHTDTLRTAAIYFTVVFAAGFVLGPVRVLLLEPKTGVRAATLIEIPVMLVAILMTARWLVRKRAAMLTSGQCLTAGVLAALTVFATDFGVGIFLRRMPAREVVQHGDPVAAAAYYAALVTFATALWITKQALTSTPTTNV